jgi:glycosyltransferase involved in cell wall biosynthesis
MGGEATERSAGSINAVHSDPVPAFVLASNLGGGIRRHLDLAGSVIDITVHELPDPLPLLGKVQLARRLLRSAEAHVVVTHGVAAAVAARHRGRVLATTRHVEYWHGDPFFLDPRRRFPYRALARLGRPPELQVFTHEWLVPLYHDRRCDFEVLPNTVPLPELAPAASDGAAARTAVFLGRLSEEKGLGDLLAAWPPESAALGWRLDVHGTGPLQSARHPGTVTFRGDADNPMAVLSEADLVVIPSWTETGPYTACEAMAVGRPFLGTRTGDMPEFLASGCGWGVRPRRQDELRAALLEAQSAAPDVLAAMGQAGRRWLATNRPFGDWARAVERIYAP